MEQLEELKKVSDFMLWSELWDDKNEPSNTQVAEYVATPLWSDLENHLRQTYKAEPKLSYSGCSMDNGYWKGWNIKYKKSGKALCSLYPKQGHFIALVNIGAKESTEADLLIPLCDEYMQNLYHQTKSGTSGKALAIQVTNENILRDTKELIALRVNSHIKG